MKQFIRIQIIIVAVLVAIYGVGFWMISNDQKEYEKNLSSQTQLPAGMKYMKYCDGALSDQQTTTDDTSCLAENPGEFSKFASAVYLILFYIVLLFVQLSYIFIKRQKTRSSK